MLAPICATFAALAALGLVLRDEPPEDCFERYCSAALVSAVSGSAPAGVTFSIVPLPEVAGEGTWTCATCPEKPCKGPVQVQFDPGPSNAFYIELDGKRIVGPMDETKVLERNCLQDASVELDVALYDLNNNDLLADFSGALSCDCTPLPD